MSQFLLNVHRMAERKYSLMDTISMLVRALIRYNRIPCSWFGKVMNMENLLKNQYT
nr:MAG TPA: hypothetical protein [Bacteriophage sp.]